MESALRTVVGVDHGPLPGPARLYGHTRGCVDHGRRGTAVHGPTHDLAGPGVQHGAAMQLALFGPVLGYVGHPQQIGPAAAEVPVHQVLARLPVDKVWPAPPPPGQAAEAELGHDRPHQFLVDDLAIAIG